MLRDIVFIEQGVPMPDRAHYPFKHMRVGDSFVVGYEKRNSVATNSSKFAKQQTPAWHFVTRRVSDKEARIWRDK